MEILNFSGKVLYVLNVGKKQKEKEKMAVDSSLSQVKREEGRRR